MTKRSFHYAWIILVVTFLALLISAGVRNATSVLFDPLEGDFGWDRASAPLGGWTIIGMSPVL